MRGKFSFLYIDIWFNVTECKFIMENSSFKMLVVFSFIFVADTKIIFVYNFVAPLSKTHHTCRVIYFIKPVMCKKQFILIEFEFSPILKCLVLLESPPCSLKFLIYLKYIANISLKTFRKISSIFQNFMVKKSDNLAVVLYFF